MNGSGADPDEALRARLAAVCGAAGLDPSGARLVKFTNNIVFRLAGDAAVVRIAGSRAVHYRVGKVVAVARWLAAHGFPAVRLLPGVDQPVTAGGDLATVWEAVPDTGPPPTPADLGRLLRRLHALPSATLPLPPFEPVADARRRLEHADELDGDALAFLHERCDQVEAKLARVSWVLPRAVLHGDAHGGTLIPGPDGPVLCDFDSACAGPPEWDLLPEVFGTLRFGRPRRDVEKLAAAYGFDVTGWDGLETLVRVRELRSVVSVAPVLRTNPGVRTEFFRRLQSLRTDDRSAVWTPYS